MATRLFELVFDCADPARLVRFWAAAVGGEPVDREPDWSYVDPPDGGPRWAFQRVPEGKSAKNRLHPDLAVDDIDAERVRLCAAGATAVGGVMVDGEGPFQVMLDPEGNEFCLVS